MSTTTGVRPSLPTVLEHLKPVQAGLGLVAVAFVDREKPWSTRRGKRLNI
jgi:hypothetical protein